MKTLLYSLLSQPWGGLAVALVFALMGLLAERLARWREGSIARWFGFGLLAFALLLSLGSGLANLRRFQAERNYEPRGALVDVHGHEMHILVEGPEAGEATLVWIPGGHAQGLVMYHLHARLRRDVRSVLFDRFGAGWSDPGPYPRSTAREAEELATLLQQAGESGPFILAGHSYGGLLAANFARRYPERTAGLILLDPSHPDAFVYPEIFGGSALSELASVARRNGVSKAFGLWFPPYRGDSSPPPEDRELNRRIAEALLEVQEEMDATRFRPAADFATASIFDEFQPERFQAEAPSLIVYDEALTMPVYLVIPPGIEEVERAVTAMDLEEREASRALNFFRQVRLRYRHVSPRTRIIHTPSGVGHNFIYEVPEFVVRTVRGVVADVRGRTNQGDWEREPDDGRP